MTNEFPLPPDFPSSPETATSPETAPELPPETPASPPASASAPAAESAPRIGAELSFSPVFNLAFHQNAIPVVQELKLTNLSGEKLTDLTCTFSAVPEMICPKTLHADGIGIGETIVIRELGVELSYNFLTSISEAVKGKLKLRIERGGEINIVQCYRRIVHCRFGQHHT